MHLSQNSGIEHFINIMSSSTTSDYVQQTYSELQLHLSLTLPICLFHFSILELWFQKMVSVHSTLYLERIIFEWRIAWELVFQHTWSFYVSISKNEVVLLYH
jgi:hypothetical protein